MNLKYFFYLGLFWQLMSCSPSGFKPGQIQPNSNELLESKVIDGEVIMKRESIAARSVVAVELLNSHGQIITYCTGVLIAPNTILTAAHCFNPDIIPDVKGFNVTFETRTKFLGEPIRRKGFDYVQHPQFNTVNRAWILEGSTYLDPELHPEKNPQNSQFVQVGTQNDHDLAVGVFQGAMPKGFEIVAIDTNTQSNYVGKQIYFYGFGRAVDYLDKNGKYDTSTGQLRKGTAIIDGDYLKKSDRYFTSANSKNSICQGDSGGPQFLNENGVLKVIGINSAVASEEGSKQVDASISAGGMLSCRGRSQVSKVSTASDWILQQQNRLLSEMKADK